ncbi:MAG TPA: hypothetical protein VJR89_02920 [Polyangiales bacterium]|nr:hypothetical protein [Polyangiales bacterium]
MGLLSILLSALAVVCAGIGVLTAVVPKVGLIFAFGAPALAVAGIMLGGSAMSRAKRAGQTSETGKLGAILSAVAFVPSVLVALTCGVCNAFFSTGDVRLHKDFRVGGTPFGVDAGARALPPPQRLGRPQAGQAAPDAPQRPANPQPADTPPPAEPALPPPPLPPGPGK